MAGESVQRERVTDLGAVRIYNDVLASIASIAASEIKGVHRLGQGSPKNFSEFLARRGRSKGVRVSPGENGVRIAVSIIVEYGVYIPRVADEVQENIKRQVEKMTGLVLQEVNVDVEGVRTPFPAKSS